MMKNASETPHTETFSKADICPDDQDKLDMVTDTQDPPKLPHIMPDSSSDKENVVQNDNDMGRKHRVPFQGRMNGIKSKPIAKPNRRGKCSEEFTQEKGIHHQRVFRYKRTITCQFCDASFNTKGQLATHSLRKHRIGALSCSICHQGLFNSLAGLRRHRKLKHGLGKWKHRTYRRKSHKSWDLNAQHQPGIGYEDAIGHVLSDYLQKPCQREFTEFHCNKCDAFFARKSGATTHSKSKHSREKPKNKKCSQLTHDDYVKFPEHWIVVDECCKECGSLAQEDYQHYIDYPEHWIVLDEC